MKKIIGKYPFFLFLMPLFIVLHVHQKYNDLIDYPFVYKDVVILFVVPVIVYIAWRIITRNTQKAALNSFITLFFFYFLGELKNILKDRMPESFVQSYTFLLPAGAMIMVIAWIMVLRSRKDLAKLIGYINVSWLLFICIDLVTFARPGKGSPLRPSSATEFTPCTDCDRPDIYYLIFDSYTSSEALRTEFDFNNDRIESYLRENGFTIPSKSSSNYNLTPFSIASTLHMNYLSVDTSIDYYLFNYLPGVRKVYDSPLFGMLEKQGYEVLNHSIFHVSGHPSSVPTYDEWNTRRIFQQYNILKKADNEIGWMYPSWLHLRIPPPEPNDEYERDRHDSIALNHLLQTIRAPRNKPRFVYAHIFIPHEPYTFDSSGNKIEARFTMPAAEKRRAYVQQLIYVNTVIKNIVEQIKSSYPRMPVIVIQGDHGYRYHNANMKQMEFENLNAIHLPTNRPLPDTFSNVNTFRLVFNELFRANYSLLPDSTFFLQYK